jgi:hypothetical protein
MANYIRRRGPLDLVKTTFSIYWRAWKPLVSICALILLPLDVLQDILDRIYPKISVGVSLVEIFAYIFVTFLLVAQVSQIYFGNEVSLQRPSFRFLSTSLFRLYMIAGVMLVLTIVSIFIPLFLLYAIRAVMGFSKDLLFGIFIVIACCAFVLIYCCDFFAIPAAILEKGSVFKSVQRGFQLALGSFWKTLGSLVLFYIVLFFCSLVLVLVLALAGDLALLFLNALLSVEPAGDEVLKRVAYVATDFFSVPLAAVFETLLYYNLRIERQEMTAQTIVDSQLLQAV